MSRKAETYNKNLTAEIHQAICDGLAEIFNPITEPPFGVYNPLEWANKLTDKIKPFITANYSIERQIDDLEREAKSAKELADKTLGKFEQLNKEKNLACENERVAIIRMDRAENDLKAANRKISKLESDLIDKNLKLAQVQSVLLPPVESAVSSTMSDKDKEMVSKIKEACSK